MESILTYMSDGSLSSQIVMATKTASETDDLCPVFESVISFGHSSIKNYSNMSGWEGVTVNSMMDRLNMGRPRYIEETAIESSITDDSITDDSLIDDLAQHRTYNFLKRCRFRRYATHDAAEQAILLIEKHSLTGFPIICRGLVYFPDLLYRYLKVHETIRINDDDLASMVARCIQQAECDTYGLESISHILSYLDDKGLEIKLLPGKYPIDLKLYELVKTYSIQDRYYDAGLEGINCIYEHTDLVNKTQAKEHVSYRDAYHCLLYGSDKHLQALIVKWDIWGDDCTGEAARDFFDLDMNCHLDVVIHCVNKRSQK